MEQLHWSDGKDRKFIVEIDIECECVRVIVLNTKLSLGDARHLIKEIEGAISAYKGEVMKGA